MKIYLAFMNMRLTFTLSFLFFSPQAHIEAMAAASSSSADTKKQKHNYEIDLDKVRELPREIKNNIILPMIDIELDADHGYLPPQTLPYSYPNKNYHAPLTISDDGTYIVAPDAIDEVWNTRTKEIVKRLRSSYLTDFSLNKKSFLINHPPCGGYEIYKFTGEKVQELPDCTRSIMAYNSNYIVTQHEYDTFSDNIVYIYDTKNNNIPVARLNFGSRVKGCVFNPGGTLLAIQLTDKVIVCNSQTSNKIVPLPFNEEQAKNIKSIKSFFSHDGNVFATLYYDNVLRLWDPFTWKEKKSFKDVDHNNNVSFSPRETKIVVKDSKKNITLIDKESGKRQFFNGCDAFCLYPDDTRIVISKDNITNICNTKTENILQTFNGTVRDMQFDKTGKTLALALDNKLLLISYPSKKFWILHGHENNIEQVHINDTGTQIITVSDEKKNAIKIWENPLNITTDHLVLLRYIEMSRKIFDATKNRSFLQRMLSSREKQTVDLRNLLKATVQGLEKVRLLHLKDTVKTYKERNLDLDTLVNIFDTFSPHMQQRLCKLYRLQEKQKAD